MQRRMVKLGVVACVLALMAGGLTFAQQQGGRRGGGQGDQARQGGGRGNFDMAQMRQMMTQRMRDRLGVKDDAEWQLIEPRVEKVMTLNREVSSGGRSMFGMMGRGGPGGPGGRGGPGGDNAGPQGDRRGPQREETAVEKAMTQLETVLQKESASQDEIKTALTGLRAAREKAQQNLTAAQEDLKKVLTVRQEAIMVTMGLMR